MSRYSLNRNTYGLYRVGFEQAIWAIRDKPLRAFLSIAGIAIGIAAVVGVEMITQSARSHVFNELKTYGLNTIWIYRQYEESVPNKDVRSGSGIDNSDYQLVQSGCCPSVLLSSPVVYDKEYRKSIRADGQYVNVNLEGVGVDYLSINNDILLQGRVFRADDIARKRNVVLITEKAVDKLFGDRTNIIGRNLYLNQYRLVVIGIIKNKQRDFLSSIGAAGNYDVNERILIPYSTHQQISGHKEIHTLQLKSKDLAHTSMAIDQVLMMLARSHDNNYSYVSESMQQWIDTANNIMNSISLIGVIAASISLFVGGLGVMSLMSTSVVERTREIGIHMALGATSRDVQVQFLLESAIMCVIGGLLGLLLGAVIALGVSLWSGYIVLPSVYMLLFSMVISVAAGLASGYIPALRASRLLVVDALRHD